MPKVFEPKKSLLTVSQAVWLILRHLSQQSEDDLEAHREADLFEIAILKKQHPHLNTAIELAMDFAALVRRKQPNQLEKWLKNAEQSQIKAITGFATRLRDDWIGMLLKMV